MLSNTELLKTIKKLLGVCCDFSYFIQKLQVTDSFEEEVTKFDLGFTSVLISLLVKISQLARENYNEKILNILHRLDFNGFYSKALDTFRGHPSKEVPPAASTKSTTISYPN